MTTSIDIALPWGRYHATAWDRNANEGAPDWPPAPWRLVRALYASWKWHCPSLDTAAVESLLDKLSAPPTYQVPPFRLAHTRHYFPEADHSEGVEKNTTLTFDSFVVTARNAVLRITWDCELTPDELRALEEILPNVAYLGRADSLVDATLADPGHRLQGSSIAIAPGANPLGETLRLLAPERPVDFEKLTARPLEIRKQRQRQPPGTIWAQYPAPQPDQTAPQARPPKASPWDIAGLGIRFSVTGAPKQLYQALALGDALHSAYIKGYGKAGEGDPMVTGLDSDGSPLTTQHQHAHNFSLAGQGKDRVETMVVWVPGRMRQDSLGLVARTHSLFSYALGNVGKGPSRSSQDVLLGVESIGSIEQVAPEICATDGTEEWRSLTPYALTRQSRRISEELIANDIANELDHRGLPPAVAVEVVIPSDALRFRRKRAGRSAGPVQAFMVRLRLSQPVAGPLSLGQFSHFGLGLFVPA